MFHVWAGRRAFHFGVGRQRSASVSRGTMRDDPGFAGLLRDALLKCLRPPDRDSVVGGLAVVLRLPDGAPDVSIAKEALTFGLAPTPLSLWYASRVSAQSGLLLGIATAPQKHLAASCDRLYAIIDRCT